MPRFGEVHVRKAMDLLLNESRMSRKELSKRMGIGEGSVRTIMKELKNRGLVRSTRSGHFLTERGIKMAGAPRESAVVSVSGITVGSVNVAILVRKASHLVRRGIEQRDEAIKVGAKGATVLICEGGRLVFPDRFMKVGSDAEEELFSKLSPEDGDVIVIGTADDLRLAEEGARAAARTLHKSP
ncbi:MAG: DUF4443 domain-containing protein [Candidatus Hadarchaeales archaeon]